MHDRLLTLRAVCRRLSVTSGVLLTWISSRQFPPPILLPNGRQRWRAVAVSAWVAGLAGGSVAEPEDLPELAKDMLQAMRESEEEWVPGKELARLIGGDADITAGNWGRASLALREAGLIVTHKQRGYRLVSRSKGRNGD